MVTIDGIPVRSRPISWVRLYCGCTTFYDRHHTQVDDLALCPTPDPCTGHDHGVTAVKSILRTELVG